jgi:hypothetical protein
MAIVTLSREFGSEGDAIGQAVAHRLHAPYLDQEIMWRLASRLGLTDPAPTAAPGQPALRREVLPRLVLHEPVALPPSANGHAAASQPLVRAVIEELAASGNAVIVGRGGQVILRGRPDVLHVHIGAPLALRVERVMRARGISRVLAEAQVLESDRARAAYLRATYDVDWHAPELYDLMLTGGRLPRMAAVDAIMAAATALAPLGQPATAAQRLIRQERYSVRQAAALLLVDPAVLRQAVYAGDLPAIRLGKAIISLRRRDLLHWLERRSPPASAPTGSEAAARDRGRR